MRCEVCSRTEGALLNKYGERDEIGAGFAIPLGPVTRCNVCTITTCPECECECPSVSPVLRKESDE